MDSIQTFREVVVGCAGLRVQGAVVERVGEQLGFELLAPMEWARGLCSYRESLLGRRGSTWGVTREPWVSVCLFVL